MNPLTQLLELDSSQKSLRGVVHTPREIVQQPSTWQKAVQLLADRRSELETFLFDAGLAGQRNASLFLAGAGSSEFVGTAVAPLLQRRLQRPVSSIPTTHLVTHLDGFIPVGQPSVLLSFARSGNSPESIATYQRVRRHLPDASHIVVTCNSDGNLARRASEDSRAICLVLPEETNDRSLVMTSSYSTMALAAAGLGYLQALDEFATVVESLSRGARRILENQADILADFASIPFSRACFLGSGTLWGTAHECQLKMLEMSDGQVSTRSESYLGLRHGPQVFVDDRCVVVALLSSNEDARRYEIDMLQELKAKNQGCGTLVVCDRAHGDVRGCATHVVELWPEGQPVDDDHRIMTDVVAGQLLATFKCLELGLKPDSPSATGVINRVVQGVVIYD